MSMRQNPSDELHDLHQIAAFLTFVAYNFAEASADGMTPDECCGMALVLGNLRDRIEAARNETADLEHAVRSSKPAAGIGEADVRFLKQFARSLLDGPEVDGSALATSTLGEGLTKDECDALRDFARGLAAGKARADS